MAWSGSSPSLGLHYAHFDYDGLGRLSRSQYDTDADGSLSDEDAEWTPRDHLGRPIGIWRQAPTSGACAKPYQVFAYHNTSFRGEGSDDSRGILDAPAVRWRDTSGGGGDLTEVVSYLQDFRGDVRAVVSPSSGILERDRYGLTGRPEAFPAADVNFDGKVDTDDSDDFAQAKKQFGNSAADYDPRADLDRDGDVDDDDEALFNGSYGDYAGYSGQWKLSAGEGLSPGVSGDKAGLDNRFGWRGYWYDSHLQVYHVRNRAYDPRQGQFLQTDPLGFSAGDQNLYRYADGNFSSGYDPLGLDPTPPSVLIREFADADLARAQRFARLWGDWGGDLDRRLGTGSFFTDVTAAQGGGLVTAAGIGNSLAHLSAASWEHPMGIGGVVADGLIAGAIQMDAAKGRESTPDSIGLNVLMQVTFLDYEMARTGIDPYTGEQLEPEERAGAALRVFGNGVLTVTGAGEAETVAANTARITARVESAGAGGGEAAAACGAAATVRRGRLIRDALVTGWDAPRPLETTRLISRNPLQNALKDELIEEARRLGARDIRVNQWQTDINGRFVGMNRPDIQYTLGDQRIYIEIDSFDSVRGPGHQFRLLANDPTGEVRLIQMLPGPR